MSGAVRALRGLLGGLNRGAQGGMRGYQIGSHFRQVADRPKLLAKQKEDAEKRAAARRQQELLDARVQALTKADPTVGAEALREIFDTGGLQSEFEASVREARANAARSKQQQQSLDVTRGALTPSKQAEFEALRRQDELAPGAIDRLVRESEAERAAAAAGGQAHDLAKIEMRSRGARGTAVVGARARAEETRKTEMAHALADRVRQLGGPTAENKRRARAEMNVDPNHPIIPRTKTRSTDDVVTYFQKQLATGVRAIMADADGGSPAARATKVAALKAALEKALQGSGIAPADAAALRAMAAVRLEHPEWSPDEQFQEFVRRMAAAE